MATESACNVTLFERLAHNEEKYSKIENGTKSSPIDLTASLSEADSDVMSIVQTRSVDDSPLSWQGLQSWELEAVPANFLQEPLFYDPISMKTTGQDFCKEQQFSGFGTLSNPTWMQEDCSSEYSSPESALSNVSELSSWDEPWQFDSTTKLTCKSCWKRFDNAYSLESHAQRSGHKIFSCPVSGCQKAYCRRDSWTRHKKSHEVELMCPECRRRNIKKVFKRKDHLRTHIRNAHPDFYLPPDTTTPAFVNHQMSLSGRCSCPCSQQESVASSTHAQLPSFSEQLLCSDLDTGALSFDSSYASFLNDSTTLQASGLEAYQASEPENQAFESIAVRELLAEIRRIQPKHANVVQELNEIFELKLSHTTTTQELARSLAQLVVDRSKVEKLKTANLKPER